MRRVPDWVPSLVGLAGLVATLVMVQLWAARLGWQWDATWGGQFTLAPFTKAVLQRAGDGVRLYVFVPTGWAPARDIVDLAERLRRAQPRLSVQIFDTNRNPELARRLQVQSNVAVVVEGRRRTRVVTHPTELSVAAAVAAAAREDVPRVQWVHRTDRPAEGFTKILSSLVEDGFQPVAANGCEELPTNGGAILVLVGTVPEEVWRTCSGRSGRWRGVLLLAEADACVRSPSLCAWLRERWRIVLTGETVLDPASRLVGGDPYTVPVPGLAGDHPVSAVLGKAPLFSGATVVESVQAAGTSAVSVLLFTAPSSVAVEEAAGKSREGAPSRRGPVAVGVAAEDPGRGGEGERLVVLGDSDFVDDRLLDFLGNRDLILNALNWLANDAGFLGERAEGKPFGVRQFFLSAQQTRHLVWFAWIVPASVFFVAALVVWRWRRAL